VSNIIVVAVAGGIFILCCAAVCAYFVFTFRKQQLIDAHIGDFYGRVTESGGIRNTTTTTTTMTGNNPADNKRKSIEMRGGLVATEDSSGVVVAVSGSNNDSNDSNSRTSFTNQTTESNNTTTMVNENTTVVAQASKRFSLSSYLKAAQVAVTKASGGAVTISLAADGSFRIEKQTAGPDPYAENEMESGTDSAAAAVQESSSRSARVGELRSDVQPIDEVYRNSLVLLQNDDITEHHIDDQQRERLSVYHRNSVDRNSVGRLSTGQMNAYTKSTSIEEDPVIEDHVIEDPVIEDPVIEDPVIEDHVIKDHVIEDHVIEDPVIKDHVIDPIEDPIEEPLIDDDDAADANNKSAKAIITPTEDIASLLSLSQSQSRASISDGRETSEAPRQSLQELLPPDESTRVETGEVEESKVESSINDNPARTSFYGEDSSRRRRSSGPSFDEL